ncbi:MAG: hypothetical protein SangKO_011400 [Sandaracinaceae bacterium]
MPPVRRLDDGHDFDLLALGADRRALATAAAGARAQHGSTEDLRAAVDVAGLHDHEGLARFPDEPLRGLVEVVETHRRRVRVRTDGALHLEGHAERPLDHELPDLHAPVPPEEPGHAAAPSASSAAVT